MCAFARESLLGVQFSTQTSRKLENRRKRTNGIGAGGAVASRRPLHSKTEPKGARKVNLRTLLFGIVAILPVSLLASYSNAATAAKSDESAQKGAACDRACLQGFVDKYLDALVAHDPSSLPVAKGVKYTENTAQMPLGDGLWVGASEKPATFMIYALDPVAHQAGFMGVMKEFGKPVILVLRLKVENGKITEVEHIVYRDVPKTSMPNLVTPRSGLVESVPPAERVPRQDMVRIALSYFDSIEQSNGNVAPFADDCERHENGMQTTSIKTSQPSPLDSSDVAGNQAFAKIGALGCRDGMNTHAFSYITRIQPRRPLIVDEEMGLVFTFPMFNHRGKVQSIKIVGVPGVDTIAMPFAPFNLEAGEIFKIRRGQIHEIEAAGFTLPYNSRTGWEAEDARQQASR